jgi:hypothetical protein
MHRQGLRSKVQRKFVVTTNSKHPLNGFAVKGARRASL